MGSEFLIIAQANQQQQSDPRTMYSQNSSSTWSFVLISNKGQNQFGQPGNFGPVGSNVMHGSYNRYFLPSVKTYVKSSTNQQYSQQNTNSQNSQNLVRVPQAQPQNPQNQQ